MSTRPDAEPTAVVAFPDRVAEAVERKRSQLVVGLDPRIDLLPVELRGEALLGRAAAAGAIERFCKGIVDAVAPYVVAVKPQVAFFEALGSDGWRALEAVSRYASEAGLLVIADAKRGDIGSTARAYAAAFLEPRGAEPPLADALTVNPYLGIRLDGSLPLRVPQPRRRHLLPRPNLERRRPRPPGRRSLGRDVRSGATSPASSPSGAPTSSASAACRASARSSARRCRG